MTSNLARQLQHAEDRWRWVDCAEDESWHHAHTDLLPTEPGWEELDADLQLRWRDPSYETETALGDYQREPNMPLLHAFAAQLHLSRTQHSNETV